MREWIVTLTDQYDTTTIEQSNKLSVEDQLKKEVGQLKEQIEYISCLDIVSTLHAWVYKLSRLGRRSQVLSGI